MSVELRSVTRARKKDYQRHLFPSDLELMRSIPELPKVDLHRHITGSISGRTAVRLALKYDVELPTFIVYDLEKEIFPRPVDTLEEYFRAWPILNRLFVSQEAIREIVLQTMKDAAEDNVVYTEIRTNPRGFLGENRVSRENSDKYSFEEFLETVSSAIMEGEKKYGVVARIIVGISRHIFIRFPEGSRSKMFRRMVTMISQFYPQYVVGVDLNGDEKKVGGEPFDYFFWAARSEGLPVTIHAGEEGPVSNVRYALNSLKADRIGHGLAAASDPDLMKDLVKKNCALEICPTSNEVLNKKTPLKTFKEHGVPFAVCTDNPARCFTTLSEELFKVAKTLWLTVEDLEELTRNALNHSFADAETKKKVEAKLK